MKNNKVAGYESPEMEMLEMNVESGFAGSSDLESGEPKPGEW